MRRGIILAIVISLCWSTAAAAQEPALDLIPHDAGAALIARNVKELSEKGDKFAKEMNLRNPIQFSQLFAMVFNEFGAGDAWDRDRPAAILAVSAKSVGAKSVDEGGDVVELIVIAIPFKDIDAIGAQYGFNKGDLKPGKVRNVPKGPKGFLIGNRFQFAYVRGNHFYLGSTEKAVVHAASTKKRFGGELSAEQRKRFGQADVVLQVGTFAWGKFWQDGILKQARRVLGDKMDAREKEMGEKIVKSMEGIHWGLAGLRIEKDGLNLNLLSTWDKKNPNVQEILSLLRFGNSPTKLDGLPTGHLLFGEAAKGNGVANAMLARVLFKAALQEALGTDEITTPAERAMVVGVFNEIWYHLLGNRTALYHNEDAKKQGALGLVSILDTADGQKFFDHMAHLAKIADGDLKPDAGGLNVDAWVKDLGSKEARKQELAMLKLRLLGEPALPALQKGMAANNKDVSELSKTLRDEITQLAQERKQGAPAGNWFLRLRPTLQVQPKTEERAGFTVHILKLRLSPQAKELAGELEKLFGPHWDQVRFAIDGKNVVVFWGTNNGLLEATLKNLKDGKAGLGSAKYLTGFYAKSNDSRRAEMHFAVDPIMALFDAGPAGLPKASNHALSSLGLSVEEDSLEVNLWLPLGQARLLAKILNL